MGQVSQRMAQLQREWAEEIGKEAENRTLQSKVGPPEKQTHISGKESGSNQVQAKSTADSEGTVETVTKAKEHLDKNGFIR